MVTAHAGAEPEQRSLREPGDPVEILGDARDEDRGEPPGGVRVLPREIGLLDVDAELPERASDALRAIGAGHHDRTQRTQRMPAVAAAEREADIEVGDCKRLPDRTEPVALDVYPTRQAEQPVTSHDPT